MTKCDAKPVSATTSERRRPARTAIQCERARLQPLQRVASHAGSLADPLPRAQRYARGGVSRGSRRSSTDCIEIVMLPQCSSWRLPSAPVLTIPRRSTFASRVR
eukprot:3957230-Pyramimonas_sp.AAC.1